jgi:hypothetical protein
MGDTSLMVMDVEAFSVLYYYVCIHFMHIWATGTIIQS